MRFTKANRILSSFRLADNLVPLFIGVLALILSIVASVPGRLEEHSQMLSFCIGIFLILPISIITRILNLPLVVPPILIIDIFLIFPFVLFAGSDIYQIVFRDRHDSTQIQLSGIFSFLIVASTILSIQFGIPAKLCFYSHQDLFQEVVDRQVLADSEYKSVLKIRSIEIQNIIVTDSDSPGDRLRQGENSRDRDFYFVTGNIDGWGDRLSYGFVYLAANLENVSESFRPSFIHIYGKWYIFSQTKI